MYVYGPFLFLMKGTRACMDLSDVQRRLLHAGDDLASCSIRPSHNERTGRMEARSETRWGATKSGIERGERVASTHPRAVANNCEMEDRLTNP
jgi:hypothetical protein